MRVASKGQGMKESSVTAAPEGASASGRVWSAFIGGSWVGRSATGDSFIVDEPATGAPLAVVAASDAAVTAAAVADSRRAYENEWRRTTPRERSGYLRAMAAVIRDHAEELAELEAREVGKPRRDALRFDVSYASSAFDYYAGLAETLHGEVIDSGPIEARVKYEPYGVVAAILPFNWPPLHFSKKTAPAIAAGNTVVIKPGEQAPLAVLRLVELASEVLPPGVVNAVTGPAAGPALTANPMVERITFTGATSTGRAVLRAAAENLTYATMELGGKNALIVLDDADMDTAVSVAVEGMFYNQGEACTSTARLLVHSSRYDEFLARFCAAAESLVVGDGLDPRTDIGAMVDAKQQQRVLGYLRRGLDEGARLAAQGRLPDDPRLAGGFFVPPTVLAERDPRHGGRAGGDLRAGRLRHEVRHRGRGGRHRQRHRLRADLRHHYPGPLPREPPGRPARGGHGLRQQLHAPCLPRHAVRRRQGQRLRARERGRDAARVRPREEHPLPLGQAAGSGLAAAGLTAARRPRARRAIVISGTALRRPRGWIL